MGVVVFLLLFWGLLGLIPMSIARARGRDGGAWWFYGFLLFPIALIHSLCLHPIASADDRLQLADTTRACPHCAESIKRAANVCRFCGRDVQPVGNLVDGRAIPPVTEYGL